MQVSINILMGRGYDATPSIALVVNKCTYLFNTPPLIYRSCVQNNIKIKTIKEIFLTSIHPYASGGLQHFFENIKTSTAKYQIIAPKALNSYLCHKTNIVDQESFVTYLSPSLQYNSPTVNAVPIEMSESLSYIIDIDLNDLKFNQAKMKELNLPPGPWVSKVKTEGQVVEKGILIKKEDIFFIQHSHYRILLLDIQAKSDLEKVPDLEELHSFDIIIHLTPQELLDDEYFSHFPVDCKALNFVFLNDPIICMKVSNEFYENFVNFDSSLFPPLPKGHITSHPNLPINFSSLFTGLNLVSAKFTVKKLPAEPIVSCELPKFSNFALTVIGSSGAYECPAKGCSGYLLHTHGGFVIIDCGNGYLQQLCRKYGPENLEVIVKNLKCVWISHCHFDHFFGIYDILFYRKRVTNDPLLVCCDSFAESEIREKAALYGKGDKNFFNLIFNNRSEIVEVCDLRIRSVETSHCEGSMGCTITFKNNFRIAYTGDMFFDNRFASEVTVCDLLISEATYPVSKADRCILHQHMTNKQAEDLQNILGARYLLMVHTSNNYSPDEFVKTNTRAIYAFDYLCITDDNIERVFAACNNIKAKI